MVTVTPEVREFLQLLERKEKMAAMIAPSFPIDFPYPGIVGRLKRLGFSYVVEISRGAMEVNRQLLEWVKKNPHLPCITSPCPVIVSLLRSKYPHLVPFLAPIGSPMIETAQLVIKNWPGCRPVFIGPCLAKKKESKEYPALGIIVLTYKELKKVFLLKEIGVEEKDYLEMFDMIGQKTRLYPISGGLAQSAGLNEKFTDEEYDVISGPELVNETLKNFEKSRLKLLDILWCEGGCINGPGIDSRESLDKRRQKIIAHWLSSLKV